jgi:hypothetical protein
MKGKLKEMRKFLVYQKEHEGECVHTDYIDGWEMGANLCLMKFDQLFGDLND